MTVWPIVLLIFDAMMRATMSVEPPGANGTMILIGLLGKACANDTLAASATLRAVKVLRDVAKRMCEVSVESGNECMVKTAELNRG